MVSGCARVYLSAFAPGRAHRHGGCCFFFWFCEEGREQLWQYAKRACHELLNLPEGIKHYIVSMNDISEDIPRCWADVIPDLQRGLCTLFEMELEKIGKVVGIGKGYNNAVKEKAGAVAMLTSAWLVDKAKKTNCFRTVHMHS